MTRIEEINKLRRLVQIVAYPRRGTKEEEYDRYELATLIHAEVELEDTEPLEEVKKGYATPAFDPATAKPVEACLMQLMQCTWDGDLISKDTRTWLVEAGLATRGHGFNMITPAGVMYLLELGLIHA